MESSVAREHKRVSACHRTWKYLTWLEISVFSRDIKARKKDTRASMRLIVISTSFWRLEISDENTHRSSFGVSFEWRSLLIDRAPTRPLKKRRLSHYFNTNSNKISWLAIVSPTRSCKRNRFSRLEWSCLRNAVAWVKLHQGTETVVR